MSYDTQCRKLALRELSPRYQAPSLLPRGTVLWLSPSDEMDPGSVQTQSSRRVFFFLAVLIAGGEKQFFLSVLPVTLFCFVQLKNRQHFVDSANIYSLDDLIDVNSGVLLPFLTKVHSLFLTHIKSDCQVGNLLGCMRFIGL